MPITLNAHDQAFAAAMKGRPIAMRAAERAVRTLLKYDNDHIYSGAASAKAWIDEHVICTSKRDIFVIATLYSVDGDTVKAFFVDNGLAKVETYVNGFTRIDYRGECNASSHQLSYHVAAQYFGYRSWVETAITVENLHANYTMIYPIQPVRGQAFDIQHAYKGSDVKETSSTCNIDTDAETVAIINQPANRSLPFVPYIIHNDKMGAEVDWADIYSTSVHDEMIELTRVAK